MGEGSPAGCGAPGSGSGSRGGPAAGRGELAGKQTAALSRDGRAGDNGERTKASRLRALAAGRGVEDAPSGPPSGAAAPLCAQLPHGLRGGGGGHTKAPRGRRPELGKGLAWLRALVSRRFPSFAHGEEMPLGRRP